jgi:hypothetical protein
LLTLGAAGEAKKSVTHVETLQVSLTSCAKDKQAWLQERARLMSDINTKDLNLTESEAQRSLERSNWQVKVPKHGYSAQFATDMCYADDF